MFKEVSQIPDAAFLCASRRQGRTSSHKDSALEGCIEGASVRIENIVMTDVH